MLKTMKKPKWQKNCKIMKMLIQINLNLIPKKSIEVIQKYKMYKMW